MSNPYLSIVIPAHNEAQRLPPSLKKIVSFLKEQNYTAEIVVVENGSTDETLSVAQSFLPKIKNLRVFSELQRGKGLATRRGMLEAQGDYRFLCDADLSMPIEQVNRFLPPHMGHCDVGIGSRELEESRRFDEPRYRHLIGRIFNAMVRWWVLPGLQDTQCGFKCFTGEAAEVIFRLQTMDGLGFDVEAVAIALARGYQVIEIPINWYFDADSRVSPVKDTVRMVREVWQVRRNLRSGVYTQDVSGPAR